MNERHTVLRSLPDLGLAVWSGGALMGAVGLNGAAANAKDPQARPRISADGWGRWSPVNAAAVGAHVIGSVGILRAERSRLGGQRAGRVNAIAKTAVTAAALGVTAWSGALGRQVQRHADEGAHGSTEPASSSSDELAAAQRQLRLTQWAIPALTALLVVLTAQQGELQRPSQQLRGRLGQLR